MYCTKCDDENPDAEPQSNCRQEHCIGVYMPELPSNPYLELFPVIDYDDGLGKYFSK